MKYDENHLFMCECSDSDHLMLLRQWDWGKDGCRDEGDIEDIALSVEVVLNPNRNWWGRLWTAIRYVFGKRSKYGALADILVRQEDVPRIRKILDEYDAKIAAYKQKEPEIPKTVKIDAPQASGPMGWTGC